MADTKISADPSASALTGAEYLAGVQSAANVKITPAQLATYVATVLGRQGCRFKIELGSTADSDPTAGLLKFNNATPSSATFIYIDNSTFDSVDLSTFYASLGATGFLRMVSAEDPGEWAIFKWSAITDGTGYRKLAVVHQASHGSFEDDDEVLVLFDSDAVGASGTAGKHSLYIPAAAMRPSATGGCAAIAAVATSANRPDLLTLDFDASTEEYAQFSLSMLKSWNEGTVTFKVLWSHAATTTNFGTVWGLQAVAVSDDDTIDAAYGTAQTVTDTGGTTSDLYVSSESSAITIAGSPAAEDMVFFRVYRKAADGSDTLAVDARLHGVIVYFTTDAETDA